MPLDPLPHLTPRLALRRLAPDDLRAFQAYRHEPGLGRYQGWTPQPDAEAAAFLAAMAAAPLFQPGTWSQLGMADRASGALVGDMGIHVDDAVTAAEIGFTLRGASQGQGLGAEAVAAAIALVFEATGVSRVVGTTDARNAASMRLLERVGMRLRSTQHAVFRGEACVEHTFAIERTDAADGVPHHG